MTEDNEEATDALLAAALAEDSEQIPPPRDFVSMRLADDWDPPVRQPSHSRPSPSMHDRPSSMSAIPTEETKTVPSIPRRSALQLIEHLLCHPELDWLRRAQFSPSITQPVPVKPRGLAARADAKMASKVSTDVKKINLEREGKDTKESSLMEDDRPALKLVELLTTSSLKAMVPIRPDPFSASLKEIEVQVVRGRPLEIVHAHRSLPSTRKMDIPLLIVPCDGDAPGGQWMVAGPTSGDEDETDIFTSSTCYPQLWPTRLKNVLPLKADHALLLQSVLLFRTGEGARLREDPSSWQECAAMFIPFITRNIPTESGNESATDRTRRAHDEELRSLGGAPLDVSIAARRARDAVNAAATDIGVALGSFGGILAGVVSGQGSRPTPESEAEAKSQAAKATAGKRLTEQFRFVLEAARHRGYLYIVLPVGRWVRAGFSAIEVGHRLAQAIGMVEDSAFASMSRPSTSSEFEQRAQSESGSEKQSECLFRMTVVCPSTVASFWMPSIESALASSRVRRREERASAPSSRTKEEGARAKEKSKEERGASSSTTESARSSSSRTESARSSSSATEGMRSSSSATEGMRSSSSATESTRSSSVTTDGTSVRADHIESSRSRRQPSAIRSTENPVPISSAASTVLPDSTHRRERKRSREHDTKSNRAKDSSVRENRKESKRKESHHRRRLPSPPFTNPNVNEGKHTSIPGVNDANVVRVRAPNANAHPLPAERPASTRPPPARPVVAVRPRNLAPTRPR